MKALIPESHTAVLDTLEALVDRHSLRYVLETLAEVCSLKADHVRENWQDARTADTWDSAAAHVLKAGFHNL